MTYWHTIHIRYTEISFNNYLLINFKGEYAGTQGLGLLRLHSTFRHDLKIYASDEGTI